MIQDLLRVYVTTKKQSLENGEVSKVVKMLSKDMIADCLNKKGASSKS